MGAARLWISGELSTVIHNSFHIAAIPFRFARCLAFIFRSRPVCMSCRQGAFSVPLVVATTDIEMGKLRIYNASAGSGKTYSLVREYLVLLFSSPRTDAYREILAVTFTNKAAWEMKERILVCLEELSQGGQAKGMLSHIVSGAKLSEHQVRKKASDILESLYNDYSAFSVGTIDSFTTRLVRSFSHELRLPVGFDIVVDAEDILRQAVDMLMVRAGEDGKLSEMISCCTMWTTGTTGISHPCCSQVRK